MEEDRLNQLKSLAEQYHQTMEENRPKLVNSSKQLAEPIANCDVAGDMDDIDKKVIACCVQNIHMSISKLHFFCFFIDVITVHIIKTNIFKRKSMSHLA